MPILLGAAFIPNSASEDLWCFSKWNFGADSVVWRTFVWRAMHGIAPTVSRLGACDAPLRFPDWAQAMRPYAMTSVLLGLVPSRYCCC
jgi:hypothetical protein